MIAVIPNWADGVAIRPVPRGENSLRAEWGSTAGLSLATRATWAGPTNSGTIVDAAAALQGETRHRVPRSEAVRRGRPPPLAAAERGLATRCRSNPTSRATAWHQSLGAADAHLVTLRPELEGLVVPQQVLRYRRGRAAGALHRRPGGRDRSGDSRRGLRAVRAPGRRGGPRRGASETLRDSADLQRADGAQCAPHVLDARYDKPIAIESWQRAAARARRGAG